MYNVTGLFPTPVYSSTIDITENVSSFIENLEYKKNVYNKISVLKYVLNSDELSDLKKEINEHLRIYCEQILCVDDVHLTITQSWATRTGTSEEHHMHQHQNSIISGVLYISPDNPSSIVFTKQPNDFFDLRANTYHQYNSNKFSVQTKKGMLLLFPSMLMHHVEANNDTENRVSLGFNTFYKGVLGSVEKVTSLEIK